jgi:hypothetical protein
MNHDEQEGKSVEDLAVASAGDETGTTVVAREPITDDWLRAAGFKWSQIERQPSRHWILWLAGCMGLDADGKGERYADAHDFGIEIASASWVGRTGISFYEGVWHCWLRADTSSLYSRFLHVRHLRYTDEVVQMVEGLTGQTWDVGNNIGGVMMHPKHAARYLAERERLDRRLLRDGHKWHDTENDGDRAGATAQHLQMAVESGKAQ